MTQSKTSDPVLGTGLPRNERRAVGEHGAAALEFALIVPILIVLVLGIIEFGFMFQRQLALTHAAREGARIAAVGKWDGTTPTYVENQAFPTSPITLTTNPDPPSTATSGQPIVVTVTHDYVWRILPFPGTVTLTGTATMRKE